MGNALTDRLIFLGRNGVTLFTKNLNWATGKTRLCGTGKFIFINLERASFSAFSNDVIFSSPAHKCNILPIVSGFLLDQEIARAT